MENFSLGMSTPSFGPMLFGMVLLLLATGIVDASGHVLQIKGASELASAANDFPFLVVKFYAPWCGHCKKMAPDYELAARELNDIDQEIKLAEVDCTDPQNEQLKQQFGVRGFPTVKILKGGLDNHEDYKGSRESYNMVAQFKALKNGEAPPPKMDKKEGMKSMKHKPSAENIPKPFGAKDKMKEQRKKDRQQKTQELRDEAAKRRSKEEAQKENMRDMDPESRRRMKNRMKQEKVTPQERREKDAIKRRAMEERKLKERGKDRKPRKEDGPPRRLKSNNPRDHPEWDDSMEGLAPDEAKRRIKDKVTRKEKAKAKMRELNLPDVPLRDLPDWDESMEHLSFEQAKKRMKAKAERRRKEEEVPYREDMSPEELDAWRKHKNQRKKGKPSKGAPVPPPPDHEALEEPEGSFVVDLEPDNFFTVVKETPLVLVLFYLPWDGHCKKIWPEFTEASKRLNEAFGEEVLLAKIDMNGKETRKLGIRYLMQGVPEIKLFQGDADQYVDYTGEFTLPGISEFMGGVKQGSVDIAGRVKSADDSLVPR